MSVSLIVWKQFPTASIEENPWNPNRMPVDKYNAMLEDMKRGGPDAINPILIIPKRFIFKDPAIPANQYVTIDGNHRLRAAKKLGWENIRAELDARIADEKTAREVSYRKNAERGEMDPYRLAEYFKWFVDQGLTHEQIAEAHSIDRTTVTKTLSLLRIDEEVKEKLKDVPRLTISHLEPIATLKPEQQKKLIEEKIKNAPSWEDPWTKKSPTVDDVEEQVQELKVEQRREEEAKKKAEELRKAVEKSKFKTCPYCGKPAHHITWKGLPTVECEDYHEWSLHGGGEAFKLALAREKKKTAPQIPKYVRSEHTREEFREVFGRFALTLIPKFKSFDKITLRGISVDGKKTEIEVDTPIDYSGGIFLSVRTEHEKRQIIASLEHDIYLRVEPKKYSTQALKKFKSSVHTWPEPKKKEDLVKLEQLVARLFDEFASSRKRRS